MCHSLDDVFHPSLEELYVTTLKVSCRAAKNITHSSLLWQKPKMHLYFQLLSEYTSPDQSRHTTPAPH